MHDVELVAGSLALDFANTVAGDREGVPREALAGYPDLVAWARLAGILDQEAEWAVIGAALRDPAGAAAAFARAIELREAVYAAFAAVARGERPPEGAIAGITGALAARLPTAELRPADGRLAWTYPAATSLDGLLGPIAADAFELLATPTPQRIRRCDGETCGWLFLDTSKAGRRRWCEMRRGCGNQAKARRHRARQRANRAPGTESV